MSGEINIRELPIHDVYLNQAGYDFNAKVAKNAELGAEIKKTEEPIIYWSLADERTYVFFNIDMQNTRISSAKPQRSLRPLR